MEPTIGRMIIYVDRQQRQWPAIIVKVANGDVYLSYYNDDTLHPLQHLKNPIDLNEEANGKGEYPPHTWHWPVIKKSKE